MPPGSGRACAPGQALARATCAWADEMMCDDEIETHVTLLGGYLGTADIVEHPDDVFGDLAGAHPCSPSASSLLPVEH